MKGNVMKKSLFFGADLGGTTWKLAVPDGPKMEQWPIVQFASFVENGPEASIANLVLMLNGIVERQFKCTLSDVAGIGLCSPGPASIDGVLGMDSTGNLKHPAWKGFHIRKELEKATGRPVTYLNDCNAGALGEYALRFSPKANKTLVCVSPGTGLGGGAVFNGSLMIGRDGYAAEFGHVRIPTDLFGDESHAPCGCGKRGCAEAYVSLKALERQLSDAIKKSEHREHPLARDGSTVREKSLQLLELAAGGDALAWSLFERQAKALGLLLTNLSNVFNADIYVIGGGIADAPEHVKSRYLETVLATFKQESFATIAKNPAIEWAKGGDGSNALGAVAWAIESSNKKRR